MPKTAPEELAMVVASAKRLLANNPNDTLEVLVAKIIPRWDRDSGLQEANVTSEIAGLLMQAARNFLAKVDRHQLDGAMCLPVIERPQNLCIPLAIARKITKQDPKGALWIKKTAASLVLKVDSKGLRHYLDQFCLTGYHLTGRDFCGRI